MQFSEANLNAIEQVARAAIATHPEQEGTDVFDNSDVLELVGELRAERTRAHQLEWDKSLVESELAGVSENLAAERTRTETLRAALTDLIIATEQQQTFGGLIGAVLLARADAKRALALAASVEEPSTK